MVTMNDDIILAVLERCDIITVVKCRQLSRRFKQIIDKELALGRTDFSILSFRQRCSITDSVMTPAFVNILRRAAVIYMDGTGISHLGAMKLVTDYTKELHVERCPRLDLGKLIQAIAEDRWLSYDLDPLQLYIGKIEGRDWYFECTITEPLTENNLTVVAFGRECQCRFDKIEKYQSTEPDVVLCHACKKDIKRFTFEEKCSNCPYPTCKDCQITSCRIPGCESKFCKGCATETKCSRCLEKWCGWCEGVRVFHCYGCDANVCGRCEPSKLKCSVNKCHQYCAQCSGAMADKLDHWCCDAGTFYIEATE